MSEEATATIDHIEPLTICGDRGATHQKEREAIGRLFRGMRSLYEQVQALEVLALEVVRREPGELVFGHGEVPRFREAGVDTEFVGCAFDWYAINACRFFNLIGFVSNECGGDVGAAKAYRSRVCDKLLVYRNKVAAHYALTDPRPEDNEADLYVSTMDTVAFETDRFFVGSLRVGLGGPAKATESQHDYHWSLTAFHESVVVPRLIGRGDAEEQVQT